MKKLTFVLIIALSSSAFANDLYILCQRGSRGCSERVAAVLNQLNCSSSAPVVCSTFESDNVMDICETKSASCSEPSTRPSPGGAGSAILVCPGGTTLKNLQAHDVGLKLAWWIGTWTHMEYVHEICTP